MLQGSVGVFLDASYFERPEIRQDPNSWYNIPPKNINVDFKHDGLRKLTRLKYGHLEYPPEN